MLIRANVKEFLWAPLVDSSAGNMDETSVLSFALLVTDKWYETTLAAPQWGLSSEQCCPLVDSLLLPGTRTSIERSEKSPVPSMALLRSGCDILISSTRHRD